MTEIMIIRHTHDRDRVCEWLESNIGPADDRGKIEVPSGDPCVFVLDRGQGWCILNRWSTRLGPRLDGLATIWVRFDTDLDPVQKTEFTLRFS